MAATISYEPSRMPVDKDIGDDRLGEVYALNTDLPEA